jgi:hypothetical protein
LLAYSPIEVFAFCSDIGHAITGLALALSARGLFLSCTHDNEMKLLFKELEEEVENWHRVSGEERVKDFVTRRVRKKKARATGASGARANH